MNASERQTALRDAANALLRQLDYSNGFSTLGVLSVGRGVARGVRMNASYIQRWLKPLKDDKRVIFQAAAEVLNCHPDYALNVECPAPDASTSHTAQALG